MIHKGLTPIHPTMAVHQFHPHSVDSLVTNPPLYIYPTASKQTKTYAKPPISSQIANHPEVRTLTHLPPPPHTKTTCGENPSSTDRYLLFYEYLLLHTQTLTRFSSFLLELCGRYMEVMQPASQRPIRAWKGAKQDFFQKDLLSSLSRPFCFWLSVHVVLSDVAPWLALMETKMQPAASSLCSLISSGAGEFEGHSGARARVKKVCVCVLWCGLKLNPEI